jgi:hypothetical protein
VNDAVKVSDNARFRVLVVVVVVVVVVEVPPPPPPPQAESMARQAEPTAVAIPDDLKFKFMLRIPY